MAKLLPWDRWKANFVLCCPGNLAAYLTNYMSLANITPSQLNQRLPFVYVSTGKGPLVAYLTNCIALGKITPSQLNQR